MHTQFTYGVLGTNYTFSWLQFDHHSADDNASIASRQQLPHTIDTCEIMPYGSH